MRIEDLRLMYRVAMVLTVICAAFVPFDPLCVTPVALVLLFIVWRLDTAIDRIIGERGRK